MMQGTLRPTIDLPGEDSGPDHQPGAVDRLRRNTTASLLLLGGANPAAIQRILRHSDPRITTEVYGHLLPGHLRGEINRLAFGVAPESPTASESSGSLANAAAAITQA